MYRPKINVVIEDVTAEGQPLPTNYTPVALRIIKSLVGVVNDPDPNRGHKIICPEISIIMENADTVFAVARLMIDSPWIGEEVTHLKLHCVEINSPAAANPRIEMNLEGMHCGYFIDRLHNENGTYQEINSAPVGTTFVKQNLIAKDVAGGGGVLQTVAHQAGVL